MMVPNGQNTTKPTSVIYSVEHLVEYFLHLQPYAKSGGIGLGTNLCFGLKDGHQKASVGCAKLPSLMANSHTLIFHYRPNGETQCITLLRF